MGFPLSFYFFIFKLNNIFLGHILLRDKYNIGVLTVNIEFMWLDTKRVEILAKTRLSPVSKPRHINSIFTQYTNIVYLSGCLVISFSKPPRLQLLLICWIFWNMFNILFPVYKHICVKCIMILIAVSIYQFISTIINLYSQCKFHVIVSLTLRNSCMNQCYLIYVYYYHTLYKFL